MGHENTADERRVAELERKISGDKDDTDILLELASYYIEPFHREGEAIALLKRALENEPMNENAKIMLSFCHLHYSMDRTSLEQAETLLESIISDNSSFQKGAALMLLTETRVDLEKIDLMQEIQLLECSISLEPDWVLKRYILAGAYKRMGNLSVAIEQIDIALKNILPHKEPAKHREFFYETSITGRLRDAGFFEKERARLLKG